jgi:hypothetical protein
MEPIDLGRECGTMSVANPLRAGFFWRICASEPLRLSDARHVGRNAFAARLGRSGQSNIFHRLGAPSPTRTADLPCTGDSTPTAAQTAGSARPRQQVAHRAVMPCPAARRANAPVVQRLGDGAERGRTRRLYLAHDGQHVGGKGVRGLTVCRYALCLCLGQIGPVPQHCGGARRCGHGAWGPLAVLGSLLPQRQILGVGCPLWPWCYSGGRTTPISGRQLGRPPSRLWATERNRSRGRALRAR